MNDDKIKTNTDTREAEEYHSKDCKENPSYKVPAQDDRWPDIVMSDWRFPDLKAYIHNPLTIRS
jgi:hypothetical protein